VSKQLGVVFTIVFIDLLGFGIVLPLLPTYAATFSVTPAAIGFLVTSFSLLQLVAVPFWGGLSDRIGRRPVLIVGLVGSTASYVLFAFASSYATLLVSRIVAGAMGATVGVAQAYIADITPPERRAHVLGMLGAAFAMGFIIGPALGGALSTHSYASAGVVAAILCAANALAALAWLPETPKHESSRRAGRVPLGPLAAPLAASFLLTAAFAVIHVTLPLFGRDALGDTTAQMGLLFAYMGVVSAVVQGWLVGRLAPRVGEKALAWAGGLFLAAGLALVPVASTHVALYATLGALAAGSALATPSVYAVVSRRSSASQQGAALGLTQTAATMGRIVGPTTAGALIGVRGLSAPFWAGALLALFGMVAALFLPRVERGGALTARETRGAG
jgi:DHA1 family tetracycline resistance protein-like MFS transporter